MKVLAVKGPSATAELSGLDLLILHNALNKLCHGIDIPELHARMGADAKEIEALLKQVGSLYDKVDTSGLYA
jgi:hypothetical protein